MVDVTHTPGRRTWLSTSDLVHMVSAQGRHLTAATRESRPDLVYLRRRFRKVSPARSSSGAAPERAEAGLSTVTDHLLQQRHPLLTSSSVRYEEETGLHADHRLSERMHDPFACQ